ncbi:AAA family ATPase [Methanoregula sp.]|uniref:AAA family ATPase n=1 Tax=Methanoregula sp. TaxID=2052170 RepID=UPI003C72AE89
MPIQRVHVENFKSFSEFDVDLSQFNIVIGSNAAGKSNFIAVFRFLRDIATLGIVNAIALQGGAEYIRNTKIGTDRDLIVKVTYLPDPTVFAETGREDSRPPDMKNCESSYEFALRFTGDGDEFVITKDQLVIVCDVTACEHRDGNVAGTTPVGRGEIIVSSVNGEIAYEVRIPHGCTLRPDEIIPAFFLNKRLPEKTLLLETMYGSPLPHLEKFFDRIAVYDLDPKLPKKGAVITGRRELEENGSNLALVVKKLIEDPEKKRKFSNLLRDILPFVEDFSVQKFMDVSLILTLRERYAKGRDLPAFSLSDGTITIFGLIIALYFEEKPFIIIEEPVRHIHPFLVARVMGMMKEASRNKQIMITTHSTEVVKHAFLNDILLISRDSGGFSIVSRPSDKEEVRTFLENEIGIEELYVQNLLGM